MKYELGFIGCGNMGGALITAAAKRIDGNKIAACDFDKSKVEKFEKAFGVISATAQDIAQNARFLVLAVKPQVMASAIQEFAEILSARKDCVIITMAAGLSINAIRSYVGANLPVIRIMPNTPAMVGEGMILYALANVSEDEEAAFLSAFSCAGKFDKLPEELIDGASALSGCGPAFVYAFAEALMKGAVECGIPEEKVLSYTAQTLLGAAKMLETYGDPPTLIKNVCSPGGTTIEGIKALENAEFQKIASSAVTAAYKRTLELKK